MEEDEGKSAEKAECAGCGGQEKGEREEEEGEKRGADREGERTWVALFMVGRRA